MIHNMYLFESVQMGIVGLIVFNWLLFGALWGCYRKYRSPCAPWMKEIYGGLTVTFSAVALAGMSDPGAFFLTHACYLVWLLLGISCVVPRIATAEARVQEAARFNRAKAGRTTVYGQPNVPEDSRRHVGGPA
jgi:O-antigen ligase